MTPLSMGFSRQGYWSGLPCPPPRDLPQGSNLHFFPRDRTCISCRQVLYHERHQPRGASSRNSLNLSVVTISSSPNLLVYLPEPFSLPSWALGLMLGLYVSEQDRCFLYFPETYHPRKEPELKTNKNTNGCVSL